MLAGREAAAGALTEASAGEQRRAGLDGLTAEEKAALDEGNAAYGERVGFPFVVCVRGHTPASTAGHDRDAEVRTALAEIDRIAAVRLEPLLRDG